MPEGGRVTLSRANRIDDKLSFVDIAPPIPGFEKFISVFTLEAGEIALFDIGPSVSVENLFSALKELNIAPEEISYIFLTHIHIDHAGGVGKALKHMPRAKVVVHEKGEPHLVDPTRLWEGSKQALGQRALEYQSIEPVPQDRIIIARNGMVFDLGGMEIEVLETPGHASHHLSFLDRKEARIFPGEAAANYLEDIDSIRLSAPLPYNLEQALNSLDKLISLKPKSICYAHFGYAAPALDKLQRCRQQLLLWGGIIAGCLKKEASYDDMLGELRDKDAELAKLDNLPPDQRDRELYFVKNSIQGLAGYLKKYGSENIAAFPERT